MSSHRPSSTLARRAIAAVATCLAIAVSCTSLPTSQILADEVDLPVGATTAVEVLVNDYAQSDIELVSVSGSGEGIAEAERSGNTVIVRGQQKGTAHFSYVANVDGQPQTSVALIVNVVDTEPTPTATTGPQPPTPTSTPTPAPRPATVTPTPTAESIDVAFDCDVSVDGPIEVGQRFEMFATYDRRVDDIEITFDHGDGTIESGSDRQDALYLEPGTYTVRADWTTGDDSGRKICGRIVVEPSRAEVEFDCNVTTNGPIGVFEQFEMFATSNESDLVVTFDHGDGTVLADGYRQRAWYLDPGTYNVTASWRSPSGETGSEACGTIVVNSTCSATTVRRANGFCEPLIRFECTLTFTPPVEVNEGWWAEVTYSPADAPISVTIDHGDGYVDSGTVSAGQYAAPGTYEVRAQWRAGASQGETVCGQIVVAGYSS